MHSDSSPAQQLLKSMLDLQLSMLSIMTSSIKKVSFFCPIPKHYFHFLHTVTLYFPLHVWIYNCMAETKPLGTYPYLFTVSPPELSKPPPICTSCSKSLNHLNFTTLIFFSVRTTVLTILRQVFPKLVFAATILSHSQLALFIILLFNVFKVVFFFLLAMPHGMWDPSSPTWDPVCFPCIGSTKF